VDDFGTGFNSLTALRDLPIDKLTIDRAFIPAVSPDDRSTVPAASTIALAHRVSPA
jgi:sensor c-di-GMP phosphodiesterase-like protein